MLRKQRGGNSHKPIHLFYMSHCRLMKPAINVYPLTLHPLPLPVLTHGGGEGKCYAMFSSGIRLMTGSS